MMRSLAGFIMKGRLQAALIALLGIPVISTATVGLVTLRLGHFQGGLIMFVALIPTFIGVAMGRMPELLFWLSLISVLSVFAYALLLRISASWVFTLLAACALLAVLTPLLVWQADGLARALSQVLINPETLMLKNSGQAPAGPVLGLAQLSGLVALMTMVNGFTSVALGRWWQSLLYNPGGFGEEFRSLRLDVKAALVLAALALFCFANGASYSFWLLVFISPLMINALALAHFIAKAKGLGVSWLVSLYLLTAFFFVPILVVMAVIGLLDALFNFRKRFS